MPTTQTTRPRASKKVPGAPPAAAVIPGVPPAPEAAMSDAEKREVLIRIAAYSFYERRGCIAGHELDDWLQAEMEVDRQLAAPRQPDAKT